MARVNQSCNVSQHRIVVCVVCLKNNESHRILQDIACFIWLPITHAMLVMLWLHTYFTFRCGGIRCPQYYHHNEIYPGETPRVTGYTIPGDAQWGFSSVPQPGMDRLCGRSGQLLCAIAHINLMQMSNVISGYPLSWILDWIENLFGYI